MVENGYFNISNELWDAITKMRIPGEARQVFDAIMRKTYGWNKKEDKISYGQLSEATGIERRNCKRAVGKLAQMNLITVVKDDDSYIYKINANTNTWKLPNAVVKDDTGVVKDDDSSVVSSDDTGVVSSDEYKKQYKNNIKTISDDETPSQIFENVKPKVPEVKNGRTITGYFCEAHNHFLKDEYPVPNYGRAVGQFHTAFNKYGNDIFPLIDHFLNTDVQQSSYYWTQQPRVIDVFISHMDKIKARMRDLSCS